MEAKAEVIKARVFKEIRQYYRQKHGSHQLDNCDYINDNSFFIGVYPGINSEALDYVVRTFEKFMKSYS